MFTLALVLAMIWIIDALKKKDADAAQVLVVSCIFYNCSSNLSDSHESESGL